MSTEAQLHGLISALQGVGIVAHEEADFSRMVAERLRLANVDFESEVKLSPRDRIDFLVGRIGVELKTHDTVPSVIRQLDRYAQSDRIDWLVLVTASRKLGLSMPSELRGKGISTVILGAL